VSIGPIRALPSTDLLLAGRRDRVVAVSPIVGGAALKGPADRMLVELGLEASVVGVARLYAPVAGTLVIDEVDARLAGAVESAGMRCIVTPTVMSTPAIGQALARTCLVG
jgi:LPPG:FO 2-phospho-L-lactate transferase